MTTIAPQLGRPPSAADPDGDALIPVSGILDIGGSHAFVRTCGYLRCPGDISVSMSQVRQYGLRKGDHVAGTAAVQRAGERLPGRSGQRPGQSNHRQKLASLARVDAVHGMAPAHAKLRPVFDKLTPLYATERLRLESGSHSPVARIVDLVSPVGKGQRGLIVSPPKAGKTMALKAIAEAITAGNPEVHVIVLLIGERPEEVTDLHRSLRGEVVSSTFDQAAEDHIMVAELAIERAKRLVELGKDVAVLLDSVTRLGRAYNLAAPSSSRILAGGVATSALHPPRKFLGAARNIENGGSLTLLSTALVDTGSRLDDVFFEEFKGTGNMELRLRRDLAEKRVFPAVDVMGSGTRRDDLLMSREEYAAISKLRRALACRDPQQALEALLDKIRTTSSNLEFLRQIEHGAEPRFGGRA